MPASRVFPPNSRHPFPHFPPSDNDLVIIFYHFEFVVCFAPLSHEVERNIIFDLIRSSYLIEARKWGHTNTPRMGVKPNGKLLGTNMVVKACDPPLLHGAFSASAAHLPLCPNKF